MTWRERIEDGWETLKVKWFMLDTQQKQVILLAVLYAGYTLMDVAGALGKSRIGAKG